MQNKTGESMTVDLVCVYRRLYLDDDTCCCARREKERKEKKICIHRI